MEGTPGNNFNINVKPYFAAGGRRGESDTKINYLSLLLLVRSYRIPGNQKHSSVLATAAAEGIV